MVYIRFTNLLLPKYNYVGPIFVQVPKELVIQLV